MTQQGSAELIRRLMARLPTLGIVILTMHDDAAYARMALAAGARGYVVKTAADVELIKAIRAVAAGEQFCTVAVTEADGAISASPSAGPLDSLSAREREVLVYVAQGYTNQQIAERLFLSVKTIESYRSRLMTKLNLRDRAALTQFAIEQGILGSGTQRL
jgi:two-component system response regulator NreC